MFPGHDIVVASIESLYNIGPHLNGSRYFIENEIILSRRNDVVHFLLSLIPLLAVHWAAMISPGPNVLLVTQTAIARSRAQALAVGAGIATGGFLWCLATLTGITFLLTHFSFLRLALQIFGGAYLCYLAYRLWKNADKKLTPSSSATAKGSLFRAYLLGLSTNITNPKTAVYFASILPVFLPPQANLWMLGIILALISFSSLLWHSILALGFSHQRIQRAYLTAKKWIDRCCGTALGIFGLKLILSRI